MNTERNVNNGKNDPNTSVITSVTSQDSRPEESNLFPNLKPQTRNRKKRDRILLMSIGGVAVFFIVLACMIGYSIRFQLRYREFVSAISTSTTQAFDENGLFYEMEDGILHKVKRDKIHTVYKIMTMKKGIEFDSVPEATPTLIFRYPQTALLEIWEVKPSIPTSHKTVLRWRFTDSSGKEWIFEGDFISVTLLMNSITKAKS